MRSISHATVHFGSMWFSFGLNQCHAKRSPTYVYSLHRYTDWLMQHVDLSYVHSCFLLTSVGLWQHCTTENVWSNVWTDSVDGWCGFEWTVLQKGLISDSSAAWLGNKTKTKANAWGVATGNWSWPYALYSYYCAVALPISDTFPATTEQPE